MDAEPCPAIRGRRGIKGLSSVPALWINGHCDHVRVDLKTLLDGVIGGVTGGVIGGGAALIAGHQANKAQAEAAKADREELRRDRSRAAAALLLPRLADLDSVVPLLPRVQRDSYVMSSSPASGRAMARLPSGAEVLDSMRRGLLTELPLVDNDLVTRHYQQLDSMILYFHNATLSELEVSRAQLEVGRYLRWVQLLIAAYVSEKPLPADVKPPVIVAGHILDADDDWQPDPMPEGWV